MFSGYHLCEKKSKKKKSTKFQILKMKVGAVWLLRFQLPNIEYYEYHSNIIENILKHLKSIISVIAFSKNIHPSMMEANSSKSHMRLSISYNGVR